VEAVCEGLNAEGAAAGEEIAGLKFVLAGGGGICGVDVGDCELRIWREGAKRAETQATAAEDDVSVWGAAMVQLGSQGGEAEA